MTEPKITDIIEIRSDGLAIHKRLFAAASYDCKNFYEGYHVIDSGPVDRILRRYNIR